MFLGRLAYINMSSEFFYFEWCEDLKVHVLQTKKKLVLEVVFSLIAETQFGIPLETIDPKDDILL